MKGRVIRPSSNRIIPPTMDMLAYACLAFSAIAFACQAGTCALAVLRCRPRKQRLEAARRPPITIVRPLCGLEHYSRETLGSTFLIDYPDYEVLFCIAEDGDPIVRLAHDVIAEHPERPARVLIGKDMLGENPKLNNMAKGFREARFAHIVFVDSNVFTPSDYLDQLMHVLDKGAGMVSAPPVGLAPQGFWAEVECAFLNSYQARMQYAVDTLGFGFAQGKTLFFRREDLEHGGLARLAAEPAEDAAATRMMRNSGRRIRLAGPFPQLIGPRSISQMWKRQVRWARLRRATFPFYYAAEMLAGPVPPFLALLLGASLTGLDTMGLALAFLALWYGPEWILSRAAGWPRQPAAMLLRDLTLPALFIAGCAGSSFEWHGHRMGSPTRSTQRPNRWTRRLRPSHE
jgi:ceramide glucosyltransferase